MRGRKFNELLIMELSGSLFRAFKNLRSLFYNFYSKHFLGFTWAKNIFNLTDKDFLFVVFFGSVDLDRSTYSSQRVVSGIIETPIQRRI